MNEKELFEYLKTNYYHDLEKVESQFSEFDCSSYEHNVFIELKSRKTHYPTLLIEYAKYWALMEKNENISAEPWYINATPEGIFGFNLLEVDEPRWHTKRLPITTEFANRSYRDKLIGYFDVEYAKKF